MPSRVTVSATADVALRPAAPAAPRLLAPRPNPFQPFTRIAFELPALAATSGAPQGVIGSPGGSSSAPRSYRLSVFDAAGRLRRTLRRADWGPHGLRDEVRWDGRDDAGQRVPGGVYFIHLEAGAAATTTKVVLAR
jgi:hypothetical protein